MTKRKRSHSAAASSTPNTTKALEAVRIISLPPKNSRHVYTNEEYRFVWHHKEVRKLCPLELHRAFHSYFAPEVKVSIDALDQVAGRLKKTRPDSVVSVVHTEPWALSEPPSSSAKEESGAISRTTNASLVLAASDTGKSLKILSRASPKPPRHSYTNEQHRFVYFYRNVLQVGSYKTCQFFNDYFTLDMSRSVLEQLSGRLRRTIPAEVVDYAHTEPWAIGRPRTTM